ncbi:WxL domain-containing protein [Weissella cibaria]|uniref:WxL domain-containing protein n=1 Tax=Weissella cibaria TaxID=137591 RepID=UPI002A751B3A|nr:WxL domain-containing protein [Weissella cibaria]MDY2519980.1 WxL domain-containing protein [Weissella cibaria]
MMKQFLMSVAVLGAATALIAPAVSADTTAADQVNVANNQGDTTVTYVGDKTTDQTVVDPNPSDKGSTPEDGKNTTDNNGKQVKGLSLTAVPSFNFGQANKLAATTVATAKGATDLTNATAGMKEAAAAAENSGKSSIFVNDTRGGNTGFNVFAAGSSLYDAAGNQLNVSALHLTVNDGVANGNQGVITGSKGVDVYHATNLTTNTSAAGTDTAQDTKDVLSGGTQANDMFGKVAGYGNLIATGNDKSTGDTATGAVSADLTLKTANALDGQAYNGKITYTLQDATLTAN